MGIPVYDEVIVSVYKSKNLVTVGKDLNFDGETRIPKEDIGDLVVIVSDFREHNYKSIMMRIFLTMIIMNVGIEAIVD